MKTLKFIVTDQSLKKDPTCDFSDWGSGDDNYVKAEFSFSPDWQGYPKAAVFTRMRKDYAAPIIKNSCMIPSEALIGEFFQMMLVVERNGTRFTTNRLTIRRPTGR